MIYLEMNHVKKSFGDLEVLKDISLKVEEGEVLSIIGPSDRENRHCCGARQCLKRWTAVIWRTLASRQLQWKTENPSIRSLPYYGKYRRILEWYSRVSICFLIIML